MHLFRPHPHSNHLSTKLLLATLDLNTLSPHTYVHTWHGMWLKLVVLIGLDIDVGDFVVIVLEYHH